MTSLAIHRGMLLDGGDYDGVRSTLDKGKIIAGEGARWRRIGSWRYDDYDFDNERHNFEERLYGAMETDEESMFGIYELIDEKGGVKTRYWPCHHRNGRTNVLAGWHVMIDSGDYYVYAPDKRPRLTVHSSYDDENVYGWGFSEELPVVDFLAFGDYEYYYATPIHIINGHVGYAEYPFGRRRSIFTLKTSFDDELKELGGITFKSDELACRRFNRVFERLKESLPPEYFTYQTSNGTRRIHPVRYDSEDALWKMQHDLERNLHRYIRETKGLSALGTADGRLFAGCVNGNLIVPNEGMQSDDRHVLRQFRYSISAMCTIPEELMNSGLRQRIVRNIQMKAVHAKSKIVAVRKAA